MPSSADRLARALDALDRVLAEPDQARTTALELLAEVRDDEAAAVAYRAIGLAHRETGDLARALTALRRAIAVAERAGALTRAAEARMTLIVVLCDLGQTESALAEAALAAAVLTGADRARLQVNWGLVLLRIGRNTEALTMFDDSQPLLQAAGDTRFEALLLNMRGTLHVYEGRHREGLADLLRGEALTRRKGQRITNAMIQQNLGYVARRTGDIPTALSRLDKAADLYARYGKRGANLANDKADLLLITGLTTEARATVEAAIAEQSSSSFRFNLAESHLMRARAALAESDTEVAEESARTAREMFRRQRRPMWADLARHAEVAARFARGERSAALLRQTSEVAGRLAAANWQVVPHEARLLAGRIATDLGQHEQARTLLAQVARHRHRGVAEVRALAWHAQALHALSAGRPTAAEQALRAGLRVHAENNAVLGATDLRAHAAARGEELATLGLRLALERGDARAVLRWAETWRAASLRRRPVRPPDDEQLAADLAQLRRVVAELAEVEAPETRGASRSEVSRLNAERLRLEASIRDRSRYARGAYAPEPPFSPAALAGALGGRVLVEFMRLDDELHAVTVRDGVVRRHRLGSYAAVLRQLDAVRFTMNRMSRRFGSPVMQKAAVEAYDHSRAVLDGLLFGPVRRALEGGGDRGRGGDGLGGVDGFGRSGGLGGGPRPLVIVPTGSLHALPWTALPTCAGRPVSVTPSARLWLAGAGASDGGATSATGRGTVLMAGPGLAHAEPEIAALAARYPEAVVLAGTDATAANAARALDGATLAHVATHGRFRSDHPLFSSLDAHDGPLYVYDLERLGATPQLLVLSACESALSGVRPGDELMGLASAVFALGTRTLIASVTPVDDADTRTLMLALHAALAAGRAPAAALAEASAATGIGGFVCFGFGG